MELRLMKLACGEKSRKTANINSRLKAAVRIALAARDRTQHIEPTQSVTRY